MFRASHPMTDLRGGARIAGPTAHVNIRGFMETARGGGKLYSRLLTQGRPWGCVKAGSTDTASTTPTAALSNTRAPRRLA